MHKRKYTKRVVIGVAALTMLFAGTAFTDSNDMTAVDGGVTGYGETTVSGATVSSLAYNLNGVGDNVDTVSLVLDGDTTSSAVSIGFNGDATTSCGTGTVQGTDPDQTTEYTCDDGGASFSQPTSELTKTAVVVN